MALASKVACLEFYHCSVLVSRTLLTLGSGFPGLGSGLPPLTAACAIVGAAFSSLQVPLAAAGAARGTPSGCYVCSFLPPGDPFVAWALSVETQR